MSLSMVKLVAFICYIHAHLQFSSETTRATQKDIAIAADCKGSIVINDGNQLLFLQVQLTITQILCSK